jgi:predicted dehydrogenase
LAATRIAVVGAGLIGRAHVAAVQADPRCTLAALVDPSPAAAALAHAAGVPHLQSLEQLLGEARARVQPAGVVLATPNALHVPQALQCIAAGLPVLVEKPLAPTVAEAEALVRAVHEGSPGQPGPARLLVGHHRAHSAIMDKARQVLQSGALGRLVAVMGSAAFFKPDHYFDDGPWRSQPGGGPILINLIHEVHNLRLLCGEISAVQAFASNAVRGFAVEDTAAIVLRFANGALGTFLLSDTAACARSWEQTSRENPAYPSHDDEDCYVLTGTHGSLSIPTMRLRTYPRSEDRSWWKPFESGRVGLLHADPLQRQMEHFGAVVRGQAQPLVTAADGLANLRVTEAVVQAAARGCVVSCAPPA